MTNFKNIIATIVAVAFITFAVPALAVDKIIDTKIESATTAIDKNGNSYVRLLVNEDRKLQGISYSVSVPVMIFGNSVKKAKNLKAGDQLKCIVASREYRGNTSYTLRSFLK